MNFHNSSQLDIFRVRIFYASSPGKKRVPETFHRLLWENRMDFCPIKLMQTQETKSTKCGPIYCAASAIKHQLNQPNSSSTSLGSNHFYVPRPKREKKTVWKNSEKARKIQSIIGFAAEKPLMCADTCFISSSGFMLF